MTDRWIHLTGKRPLADAPDPTEAGLLRGLRRLSAIVDGSVDALLVLDGRQQIVLANAAAEALFAYPPGGLVGVPLDRLLPSVVLGAHAEEVRRLLVRPAPVEPRPHRERVPARRADGSELLVEVEFSTIHVGGEHFAVAEARDAAARVAAERALARSAELALRAERLEGMALAAGGLAHDLKNLLTIILGTLDLVDGELAPAHELHGQVATARDATLRASTMLRQLLTIARGDPRPDASLDLCAAARELAPLLRTTVGAGVHVEFDPPPHPMHAHIADAQFAQVLLNLAVNARDAMAGSGRLCFRGRAVHLNGDAAGHGLAVGDYARIEIGDDGPGMSDETRRRAFEPFFTTKPEGVGTGLGLFQTWSIMRRLGGSVEIESAPGAGTTVVLWLPLAGARAA